MIPERSVINSPIAASRIGEAILTVATRMLIIMPA
jgi:hypothetical protein